MPLHSRFWAKKAFETLVHCYEPRQSRRLQESHSYLTDIWELRPRRISTTLLHLYWLPVFQGTSAFARVFAFDSKNPTIGAEKLLSFMGYLCINFYSKSRLMDWYTNELYLYFYSNGPAKGHELGISGSAIIKCYAGNKTRGQLRKDCLPHDHHHCVVPRKFGLPTAMKRLGESSVKDDDRKRAFSDDCMKVDIVHIIPL